MQEKKVEQNCVIIKYQFDGKLVWKVYHVIIGITPSYKWYLSIHIKPGWHYNYIAK